MTRELWFLLAGFSLLFYVLPSPLASQTGGSQRVESFAAPSPEGCAGISLPNTPQSGHGLDPAYLDRSVKPCDDFYKFAAGGWVKNNPVPPAYPRWGTFNALQEHNQDVLRAILEEAAKDKTAAPGSNWQKIGDFYASCMDEGQIEAAGVKPLDPEFLKIAAIHDLASLQAGIAHFHKEGGGALFGFGSEQDAKDSTQVIAGAGQGGLGLPDRDYYLRDDDKSKELRVAYVKHVTNMFKLLGDDDAKAAAEAKSVMDIETRLAKASMTRVDLRDPDKTYHKMPISELMALTPHFSWNDYFAGTGAPPVTYMDVGQPEFFSEMDKELSSTPLPIWKAYLRWHLIHSAAPELSSKFVEENFDFYDRTLGGTKELLPRWRRCVKATDGQLGEDLGRYYVERNFPPDAKAKAVAMVKNLVTALRADISTLDWMGPETKKLATAKLEAISLKVGYPDKWRDYSAFHVDRGPYIQNALRGGEFETAFDLAKIGKPVDRAEWGMTPPTVNAYYNPSMNEIVFPAGILQPPFYDPKRDDAMNYGGIGAVIGHEMTHGFDDEGSKYDAKGNLKNWWTPEDLKNFEQRGDCIAKQFDEIEVQPGLHENGKLEEGESIADLGGLTIAYMAFENTADGKVNAPLIDGFTPDQRFFLAWTQVWASNTRLEYERLAVSTDPHPLGRYRAVEPLMNIPAFQKAWSCSSDSPMARRETKRCRIW